MCAGTFAQHIGKRDNYTYALFSYTEELWSVLFHKFV